ncbi:hypothetical protein EMIHUDRAFT_115761 [Emiliania huxleyi CCMP1516]|uniref:F-box domain-containing protein n=2 Tax=Emiliania huxleyi TaxID=2903 RepID=A0A0D3JN19_EMIH1|nr:hypothetical protein EMIHUDRAFT_115761 [Emiliania huxleyi CCMP1516]EOD24904.1 hypothetical protein EMIHUDRAFT_115761 [Emiliania huxleyi CCMP1516]|eukprot:XP_005777333.1 hypothetical protein EMIHUDRAFT_115761 [Emiliania huxleyi CCMP1516]
MVPPPPARTDDDDDPPTDWLGDLPPELHLRILEGVDDFSDCAAFSLASPRLGLALRSGLARFKDPLFAVAMRLLLIERLIAGSFVGSSIIRPTLCEASLRAYAADRRATADHFPWLARVSPALCLSAVEGADEQRAETWALRRGEERGADLRVRILRSGLVQHFEGERDAERMVRTEFADGVVHYYEGEKGAERGVRTEFPCGKVQYYEGERGAERMVRAEFADGEVQHFEGEQDAERVVRREFADGTVQYFEGEQGAERVVRREFADGTVQHFEGERGAERAVRAVRADGAVQHFEGEQGAERTVRAEFPDGIVQYYEGERGAERVVRMEFPAATCSTTRESEMGSGWCASTPPRV